MSEAQGESENPKNILSTDQEAILDLYIDTLDYYFEELKNTEKVQVEIETLHLKRILTK